MYCIQWVIYHNSKLKCFIFNFSTKFNFRSLPLFKNVVIIISKCKDQCPCIVKTDCQMER